MPIGVSESSLVWQASRDVAALIDPDGGIVIDLTGGRCHSLNGIGAFLWSRLSAAGGATMDEMVSAVQAAAADTPPSVQRDIDTFLAAMAARGLIESIALEDRHFGLGGVMRQRFVVAACLIAMVTVAISAQSGSPGQKPADQSHQGHSMQMTDGHFANLMMRHHRDGIAMTKIEESGGTSAEVKALAAKIRQGQEKDLAELDTFAKKHKPSKMAAMHEKEMEKESAASMAKLKSAKGAALDRAFAEEMAKHHQMALEMTKQTQFKDGGLKALADKMAKNQQAELQELKKHQSH